VNERLIIDGYLKNGSYEIITHAGQPDPAAVCTLMYKYKHTREALDLLHMIKNSIETYLENEELQKEVKLKKAKINSILLQQGHPGLPDETLETIVHLCILPGFEHLDRNEQASRR